MMVLSRQPGPPAKRRVEQVGAKRIREMNETSERSCSGAAAFLGGVEREVLLPSIR